MRITVCPACSKAFYNSVKSLCSVCAHCGHLFYERRDTERLKKETRIMLRLKGLAVCALTKDLSEGGAGIIYDVDSLDMGSLTDVDIDIEELSISRTARIVWTKRFAGSTGFAGLKLLQGTHNGGQEK